LPPTWPSRAAETALGLAGPLRAQLDRLREKNLHVWLPGYARSVARRLRRPAYGGHRHLLFAFCDHYEPLWKRPPGDAGEARVRAWEDRYPALVEPFRDANGRPPRHSFFFPGEEYAPSYLDRLARLARRGFGEVELHLHHDGDTAAKLRADIERYLGLFAAHGHVSRDAAGRYRYAFIHGNWCLANSRPDGRWCGVDEELPVLFETGCYADFTFPAAPDPSQPAIVNEIYWPDGDLSRRAAHHRGRPARVGERFDDRMLIIEGPLALARAKKRVPIRLENAAVTADDPGSPERVKTWVEQDIHVAGRPEWVFVKVHTHGAPEKQGASLLGEGGRRLHEALARYNDGTRFSLHYVTAREMYNVACAAMDGKAGSPADYYDYVIPPPPVARA
jgi:hypothetical protein